MEDLTPKTAKILDIIIETALKNTDANLNNLPTLHDDILSANFNVKYNEYLYYIDILEKYNVIEVKKFLAEFHIYSIEPITLDFYNEGGFTRLFLEQKEKQTREKEIEIIQFKKLKWDASVSKFQSKTKWWPLIISATSLAISLFVLFQQINK